MKYNEKQILDFVNSYDSWMVTEGCPCISGRFDGNEIYVCLYQNNECEDFIEIEVISVEKTKSNFGITFENKSEYLKEYCLEDEHHDSLKKLYLSYHEYKQSA